MTIKDTEEAIKVMQAWVDGKTIQSKEETSTFWRTIESISFPTWNWSVCEYRIKPEPMEVWLWVKEGKQSTVAEPDNTTMEYKFMSDKGWTKKKFREVTE